MSETADKPESKENAARNRRKIAAVAVNVGGFLGGNFLATVMTNPEATRHVIAILNGVIGLLSVAVRTLSAGH